MAILHRAGLCQCAHTFTTVCLLTNSVHGNFHILCITVQLRHNATKKNSIFNLQVATASHLDAFKLNFTFPAQQVLSRCNLLSYHCCIRARNAGRIVKIMTGCCTTPGRRSGRAVFTGCKVPSRHVFSRKKQRIGVHTQRRALIEYLSSDQGAGFDSG